jgi:magnesium-transporting ATPase (P-type)
MGKSGTDVARAAADLVLLTDDFAAVVAAVEQGRATFANIRKFLAYHLTDNVAELLPFVVWALSAGRIPLALGVMQILSLDLVTDQLPALALGVEPPSAHALDERPFGRHLVDRGLLVRSLAVLGLAEALVELLAFGASLGWHATAGVGPKLSAASGAAFAAVVIGQAANAFACRSETWPAWSDGKRLRGVMLAAVAAEIGLLLLLLYVTPLARVLGQGPPPIAGGLVALLAAPVVIIADALFKAVTRRFRDRARRTRRGPMEPERGNEACGASNPETARRS